MDLFTTFLTLVQRSIQVLGQSEYVSVLVQKNIGTQAFRSLRDARRDLQETTADPSPYEGFMIYCLGQ
jgi:hypothetical protein